MGKPQKLTELKAGLALGAKENEGFVDTFNWLVRFCKNLRGDDSYIRLENGLGDQPTIEWIGNLIIGSGGGGSNYTPYPAPFDFTYKEITTTSTDPVTGEEIETTTNEPYITNCVWYMGREYRGLADYAIDKTTSKTYWLKIETDTYGQFSQASIISNAYTLPTGAAVPAIPTNTDQYTHYPIWSIEVSNGTITPTFDWRQTWKTPFYSD